MPRIAEVLVVLVLLCGELVCPSHATGLFSLFPDNNLLTCYVPGPGGISVAEPRLRVSIVPNSYGQFWLPQTSGYVCVEIN